MTRRLGMPLAVLATLFVMILGWLGRQLTVGELDALHKERDQVVSSRLSLTSKRISIFLDQLADSVAERVSSRAFSIVEMRNLMLNDPYVNRIFVADSTGKLRYPAGGPDESDAERDLRQLVEPLLKGPGFSPRVKELPQNQERAGLGVPWWHAVSWRDGLHLFLLYTAFDQSVVGIEVNFPRVLSDLLVNLVKDRESPPFGGYLAVLESGGGVLASWGKEPAKSVIWRELSLAPPLQTFRVTASFPPLPLGVRSTYFNLTAGALVLGLGTILLGVFAFREYRRELREAESKLNFVGKVSHELRTPLTNVRLYAELLEKRLEDEDAKGKQYVGVIVRESERLSRLIGNVLRLGESGSGKLAIRKSSADVVQVLEAVINLYRPVFESRGMSLTLHSSAGSTLRLLDRDAVSQIVHNVLSNAEKYAKEGAVSVTLTEEEQLVIIDFTDGGPGIPGEYHQKVFEPFFRMSDKLTDGVSGTGIGLGVARELARQHGGDLAIVPSMRGLSLRLTLEASKAEDN